MPPDSPNPSPTQEVETWTIRRCRCGCIHDFPDAGCPQCGSKEHEASEVLSVVDHRRLLQAEVEKREEAQRLAIQRKRVIEKVEDELELRAEADEAVNTTDRQGARDALQLLRDKGTEQGGDGQ